MSEKNQINIIDLNYMDLKILSKRAYWNNNIRYLFEAMSVLLSK